MTSLRKELRLRQLFTLSFGTIIGVGWITVLGEWLGQAGSIGAVLGFLAGGALMLFIGLCYAEVATMFPVSGGEVAYAYEIYGLRVAFAAGWFLALAYTITTTFEAISIGWIVGAMYPPLEGPVLYTVLGDEVHIGSLLLGFATMGIITFLNYLGAKSAAVFQDVLTYAFLGVSVVFISVGLIWGDTANLAPLFVDGGLGWAAGGLFVVMASTPFWFAGFDTIPQAMGEKSEGASLHLVGRVIVLSVLAALAFYCLVILAASMAMPRARLLALELPAAGAFEAAFNSPLLGKTVLFAGLLGLITTWNAIFFAAARVVYALGKSHMIPPVFGGVHAVYRSPAAAVLFVGLVGSICVFLGRQAIIPIVNAAASAMIVVFLVICAGVMRLRRTAPTAERPYRVPGGDLIPSVAVIVAASLLVLSLYQSWVTRDGGLPLEWAILIAWSALGILFWYGARRVRDEINEAERREMIFGD